MVNSTLIRSAISRIVEERGMLPAKCLLHPAQMAAFDQIDVTNEKNPLAIPLVIDVRELKTSLRFFSGNDELVGEVNNLAIPIGFGEL